MTLKDIKEKLNEVVALVPEMNGKGFDEKVKLEDIVSYLKESLEHAYHSEDSTLATSALKIEKLKKDNKFLNDQLEKKNQQVKKLNELANQQKDVGLANTDNDSVELLKAYGVGDETSEIAKLEIGFDILIKRAGKEKARIFSDIAMGNLTQFAHDDKATLEQLEKDLPEALEKVGYIKVEGKLKLAKKEALK